MQRAEATDGSGAVATDSLAERNGPLVIFEPDDVAACEGLTRPVVAIGRLLFPLPCAALVLTIK